MGREALRPRISKCDKEKGAYSNKDLEGLQIEENGPKTLRSRISKCHKENV